MLPSVDNFQLIEGIGPIIENRLYDAGIRTFVQLAARTADELASAVRVPAKRIVKDNWIGQAGKLGSKGVKGKPLTNVRVGRSPQHYATFTIELLLNGRDGVRRTHVTHVQSGAETSWAGWQDARLMKFILHQAELHFLPNSSARLARAKTEPITTMVNTHLSDTLRISKAEVVLGYGERLSAIATCGQPFRVLLTLDGMSTAVPSELSFQYQAILYAKKLGIGTRQVVCETRGTFVNYEKPIISVEATLEDQGTYRLTASVTLDLPCEDLTARHGLTAVKEIGLLQIN